MGTEWLVTIVATIASVVGYFFKKTIDHQLGKGKLQVDEATKLRVELRGEIDRKDRAIDALEKRVDSLEEELEKTEREHNALDVHFAKYKLDVYRALIDAGVDKSLLNTVLAIQ